MFANILTGGFLKGYRTYILAGLSALGIVAQYLVGDISLMDLFKQDWDQIALTLGILTAAKHEPQ